MCVMSAMSVAGSNIPLSDWTRPAFSEFQEILKRIVSEAGNNQFET